MQDAVNFSNTLLRLLASPFVQVSGNPDQNSFHLSANNAGSPHWTFIILANETKVIVQCSVKFMLLEVCCTGGD